MCIEKVYVYIERAYCIEKAYCIESMWMDGCMPTYHRSARGAKEAPRRRASIATVRQAWVLHRCVRGGWGGGEWGVRRRPRDGGLGWLPCDRPG